MQGLQDVGGDGAAEGADVDAAAELEFRGEAVGEHQIQLGIRHQLGKAGGLDGEELDLGIGHDGKGLLEPRQPLHVDGDDALVREDELIADGAERGDDLLALDQQAEDLRLDGRHVDRLEVPYGVTVEIDHGSFPFYVL